MPRYLLLIYGDEKAAAGAGPAEVQQVMEAYGKYTQDLQNAGLMQGGEALEEMDSLGSSEPMDA